MTMDFLFHPSSVAVHVGAAVADSDARRLLAALEGSTAEVLRVGPAPEAAPAFRPLDPAAGSVDLLVTLLGPDDGRIEPDAVGSLHARAVLELGAPGARSSGASNLLLGAASAGVADLAGGFQVLSRGSWPGGRDPRVGSVSLVVQQRPMAEYCIARAVDRGLGLNKIISTGSSEGLGVADCIRYLAADDSTRVIAVAADEIHDLASFGAAFDVATRHDTPVVLFLGGDLPGTRANGTGCDRSVLYRSYLAHHMVHEAASVTDLLNVAYALAGARRFPDTGRVCLLTGSGGVGVLMADRADAAGLDVAPVPPRGQEKLHALWPLAAVKNPVDTTAQVINKPPLLADFTRTVLREGSYDAAIIFMTHIGLDKQVTDRRREPLAEVIKEFPDVFPAVTLLTTPQVQQDFERDGFLVFEDPFDAVTSTRAVVDRGTWLRDRHEDLGNGRGDDSPAPHQPADAHGRAVAILRSAGVPVLEGPDEFEAGAGAQPHAELSVELSRDATFGMTVRVEIRAAGGGMTLSGDAVCCAGPVSVWQAKELLASLRGFRGLTGARGDEPLDVDAVAGCLAVVSDALGRAGDVHHLAIEPLRVLPVGAGVLAAGVRAGAS
jgi:hypothetical protein